MTVALELVARDLGALVEDPLVLLLIEGQAQTRSVEARLPAASEDQPDYPCSAIRPNRLW